MADNTNAVRIDGDMRATPRNPLWGLLSDALSSANNYAQRPDPSMPMGKANPVLSLLANGFALPSLAETTNDLSYGHSLSTGTGFARQMTPSTAESLLSVLPVAAKYPRQAAVAAAGMLGGQADASMAKIISALPMDEASRAARMGEMGMERGWFRGGQAPVGNKRTGPWYTQNSDEATGYAKRIPGGDVREYAIPANRFLNAGSGYNSKLAHDAASILETPYYGKPGQQLAKELRTFGPDEQISGGALWQALESRFGNDGAAEVVQQLGGGHFSGVKGITGPDEAYVFKTSPVRDAKNALFDPANRLQDNIMGGVTLPGLVTAGGAAGVGSYLLRRPD